MTAATATPPQAPPAPPRMTAEEFGLKYAGEHVEYVDGVVKEMPRAGGRHGKVCFKVAFLLGQFTEAGDLGHVFTNDTFVKVPTRTDPERVYGPDVCFVSYERMAKDAEVPVGTITVVPHLVIEVRSPSAEWTDAIGKMLDYLRAGVTVGVILDPATRSASVFRTGDRHEIFEATQELTLPDVLPGFAVPVAKFFE